MLSKSLRLPSLTQDCTLQPLTQTTLVAISTLKKESKTIPTVLKVNLVFKEYN